METTYFQRSMSKKKKKSPNNDKDAILKQRQMLILGHKKKVVFFKSGNEIYISQDGNEACSMATRHKQRHMRYVYI